MEKYLVTGAVAGANVLVSNATYVGTKLLGKKVFKKKKYKKFRDILPVAATAFTSTGFAAASSGIVTDAWSDNGCTVIEIMEGEGNNTTETPVDTVPEE